MQKVMIAQRTIFYYVKSNMVQEVVINCANNNILKQTYMRTKAMTKLISIEYI